MFTARYGLIPYIEQITLRLSKVNIVTTEFVYTAHFLGCKYVRLQKFRPFPSWSCGIVLIKFRIDPRKPLLKESHYETDII